MIKGRIVQVNISRGGVPKKPVDLVTLRPSGIEGDDHRNRQYHGGPNQAVLLIASEVIDILRDEGWPVYYGALGENLTTVGLDHLSWRSGQRFKIGSATVELTKPRAPCATLNVYGAGIQKRVYDALVKQRNPESKHWGESGFYASVIEAGTVRADDIIELIEPVGTSW